MHTLEVIPLTLLCAINAVQLSSECVHVVSRVVANISSGHNTVFIVNKHLGYTS